MIKLTKINKNLNRKFKILKWKIKNYKMKKIIFKKEYKNLLQKMKA